MAPPGTTTPTTSKSYEQFCRAGPDALRFLRTKVPPKLMDNMPLIMPVRKCREAPFDAIRLRLAKVNIEGARGHMWAYLTPHVDPYVRPGLTLRAEVQEKGSKDIRKIPVQHDFLPSTVDNIPLRSVLALFLAETLGELYTLVCYCFMVAAHAPRYSFNHHFIPIDQQFIDDLTLLCSREGFKKEMRTLHEKILSTSLAPPSEDVDMGSESELSDLTNYLSEVEGSSAPNSPFGQLELVETDSDSSITISDRIKHKRRPYRRVQRRETGPRRNTESDGRHSVVNATHGLSDDNNSKLEAAVKEREAILGQIDKVMESLLGLWAREKQLVVEIEQLQNSSAEHDRGSSSE